MRTPLPGINLLITGSPAAAIMLALLFVNSAHAEKPQSKSAATSKLAHVADGSMPRFTLIHHDDGSIEVDGRVFESWTDYSTSEFFRQNGLRCGTPAMIREEHEGGGIAGGSASDCTSGFTNPSIAYDPSVVRYRITVVVHVIQNTSGTGYISPEQVQSQIDILNEDFLALPGTNGRNGTDIQIEFQLATNDPNGNPTTGITYSTNNSWFNDSGSYWNSLAWDPRRYLNIYTNRAGGALGYVPWLPQTGSPGTNADRVVCLYSSFGRNSPNPPYHQGRTCTHEVGHYLGLYHTFDTGCDPGVSPFCYQGPAGDLICDTNPELTAWYGCPSALLAQTCGSPDPYRNYMDYTDDLCMNNFTPEQAKRIRCTLEHWRSTLPKIVEPCPADLTDGATIGAKDGQVNVDDLLVLIGLWGPGGGIADLNVDDTVNVDDLLLLISAWGPCS